MSGELSPGLQELWNLYRAAMHEAHCQGMAQLLSSKNTIKQISLETGQKLLVAYDEAPEQEEKRRKTMRNFTVTQTLTTEQLSDVLCSALEGGSNYWYHIEEFVEPTLWEFDSEPRREHGHLHWAQDYPLNPGGALLIRDSEDSDHGTMRLDLEAIQKGLTILAKKYPRHLADILTENADADTGDALLQCCLFGDVVYG